MYTIILKHITDTFDPILTAIHTSYVNSFPCEERRPWKSILEMITSRFHYFQLFAAIDEKEQFVGFVSTWRLPKALYIEHFAIEPTMRNKGIGGIIIDDIRKRAGELPIVVEVELPDKGADAVRRIAFYERHGFNKLSNLTYFQPSYAPGLPGVQLILMTTHRLSDPEDFVTQLHSIVYNQ